MGLLAQTNAEIRDSERRYRAQRTADELLRRPVRLIDQVLQDLEELNLRGVKRVPRSFERRLRELLSLLGPGTAISSHRENLRVKIGIVKLMDALFAVQEALLSERHGEAYPPDVDDVPPSLIYAA